MKYNRCNCAVLRFSFVTYASSHAPRELLRFGPGFMMHSQAMWDNYYKQHEAGEGNHAMSEFCRGGLALLADDKRFQEMCRQEADSCLVNGLDED